MKYYSLFTPIFQKVPVRHLTYCDVTKGTYHSTVNVSIPFYDAQVKYDQFYNLKPS